MATAREEVLFRDVVASGTVVSNRIGRELSTQLDLEEALEASRYASHPYSSHPKDWPPLVEASNSWDLPPMLIKRYNEAGGEGTALCGMFPEIRRAWATVDNSLFIWRFDKWDGNCSEHTTGDQAICAVGLAKSIRGIFIEAIQFLLILATPVEISIIGVCCSGENPFDEVALQPLTEYSVPTSGVTMSCIACTDGGRIFLGGRDGHIYEVIYTSGSGWHKRCRLACLTAGFGSMVSRWVVPNVFNFGAVDAIVSLAIDNERELLYAQTEAMKLQLYTLSGQFKNIAEERNLIPRQRNSDKPSIVLISPLSSWESKWLHLVVVMSDGKRTFFTTSGNNDTSSFNGFMAHKPNCLKVITTRPSPPLGVSNVGPLSLAIRAQNDDVSGKYESGHCSLGTVLLSDSSSSLVVLTKESNRTKALREVVSFLPLEGRMLFVADVLPGSDVAVTLQSLYSGFEFFGLDCEKSAMKLWAKGDLSVQHIMPRRKVVVFSTMGMTEVVVNRPVDVLRALFEGNVPRSVLEEFFKRFGVPEAACMCLMLAARIVFSEDVISSAVSEMAAEAFEDTRLVGTPEVESASAIASSRSETGFSMGHVVQEAEPVFSGAHEGLCLCVSRLLFPVWEFPVTVSNGSTEGFLVCRLSVDAMHLLETKVRLLEKFLRSRRNQKRGLYGSVAGYGDFAAHDSSNKRQRVPYNPAELAAMEVRAMECIRQLLLRSGEALFLLKILAQHNMTRLVQEFDADVRNALTELTFCQLVCAEEGDRLATILISTLMRYYTGPDRGGVEDISRKFRDGCASYFKESDHQFFVAVDCLEKASTTPDPVIKQELAREAFNLLIKFPESADLKTVCKKFEDLGFYEAVVSLPLQKANAIDLSGDAFNDQIDAATRNHARAQRVQCYEIVASALRNLKDKKPVGQIMKVGVQSSDKLFREFLYKTMIDLGLETELIEFGGSDLVPFLQNGGRNSSNPQAPVSVSEVKYLDLLARLYVSKQQHMLAAYILLRLAERRPADSSENFSLHHRRQYLSNAVVQAKSACAGASSGATDNGMLDLLEGKLSVLQFQIRIKDQLEAISKAEASERAERAREKAAELSLQMKNITQLYNDYASPFHLWEICLEILYFANYSGDSDSSIVRETWARLIEQAVLTGGITEACSVIKRVGSYVYPGDGEVLPLDSLCLHLERSALERLESGVESVGDEDIPRALLAACKGACEPVVGAYDHVLANGAMLPSPSLRLRLLRSVLVVLREWGTASFSQRMGTGSFGASLILVGQDRFSVLNKGIRDKIANLAYRYMAEVKRLALPQSRTEVVYRGFKELEESLISP